MKNLLVLLTIILCAGTIVLGNFHWKSKISAEGEKAATSGKTEVEIDKTEEKNKGFEEIELYMSNLPKEIQNKIKSSYEKKKPLHLVIYGSESTSKDPGAWPDLLKQELNSTYGKDTFEVTVLSEEGKTTSDTVNEELYEVVNELQADIILYEPAMLKDNSQLVGTDNTLENIDIILESWSARNENVTILIQPPHPLYNAKFYPKEVEKLREHAEQNDLIYLNHWENWPEIDNEELRGLVTEERNKPSQLGNEVWAGYLGEYFVGGN
ncbi:SGNH/GDSL hydrolase family protein [Metabacillus herbersteinensis]|uniref:SGNH/GDSL hydrolase family protein n=1 Tax=Metabacillus herbersteinensis TaxID=283816 RepID=A0ABV6GFL1_9BACI